MRTTMDRAGRVVIPKPLRDQLGLTAGEVELTVDGAALRLAPPASDDLIELDGLLVIAPSGGAMTDDDVRALRDADRR